MNLIILDATCGNDYTKEQMQNWLDANARVYVLNGNRLSGGDMRLSALFGISETSKIDKAVFLIKPTGLMKYHFEIVLKNPQVKQWIVSIADVEVKQHRNQYRLDYDRELSGKDIRYEVLFDNTSEKLSMTKAALEERLPEGHTCVVVSKGDAKLMNDVADLVKRYKPDWSVVISPKNSEEAYKYADKIIVTGRKAEDFAAEPVLQRTERVYLWLEIEPGEWKNEIEDAAESVKDAMEESGWSLSDYKKRTLTGMAAYERMLCDLKDKKISAAALKSEPEFVIWDKQGLPEKSQAYEDSERARGFLEEQCCLGNIFA